MEQKKSNFLDLRFKDYPELKDDLEKLKSVYNVKTNTWLIKHIIKLELQRNNLK